MRNQVTRGMYVLIPKSTSIALFFHTNCRPVYVTAYWTYFQPTYLQLNSHFPHALSHQIWSFLRFSSANSSSYTQPSKSKTEPSSFILFSSLSLLSFQSPNPAHSTTLLSIECIQVAPPQVAPCQGKAK